MQLYRRIEQGAHMAQWAKRPPLKLEVPGSSPRGWFNGRAQAGNRDPFRWLETARGLSPIRLMGRAQYFPGGLAASSLNRVSISHLFAVSAMKHSVCFLASPKVPDATLVLLQRALSGRSGAMENGRPECGRLAGMEGRQ